ncbi:MAG: hypothetical protein WCQ89_15835, partial [Verrucomicrobiota bacterium]
MQVATHIHIKGAREHNLKNLELRIPRGKLVVVTGPSGSGKSSLAFDTLYAEGYRKYIESLSTSARQVLDQMKRPDVDFIHGLSPVLAIEQRTGQGGPRTTIATTTSQGADAAGNSASGTTTITPVTTVGDGVAPSSKNVGRNYVNVAVSAFTLSTSSGTDTVTG